MELASPKEPIRTCEKLICVSGEGWIADALLEVANGGGGKDFGLPVGKCEPRGEGRRFSAGKSREMPLWGTAIGGG